MNKLPEILSNKNGRKVEREMAVYDQSDQSANNIRFWILLPSFPSVQVRIPALSCRPVSPASHEGGSSCASRSAFVWTSSPSFRAARSEFPVREGLAPRSALRVASSALRVPSSAFASVFQPNQTESREWAELVNVKFKVSLSESK